MWNFIKSVMNIREYGIKLSSNEIIGQAAPLKKILDENLVTANTIIATPKEATCEENATENMEDQLNTMQFGEHLGQDEVTQAK